MNPLQPVSFPSWRRWQRDRRYISTLEEEEREEGHASMETVEPANKTISENNPNMQRSIVNGKTRGKCKMRSRSENSAGEVKSQKDQLDCSANYVLVFCHLEMLRFTVSAELHITQVSLFQIYCCHIGLLTFHFCQLAATISRGRSPNISIFHPVAPPGEHIPSK